MVERAAATRAEDAHAVRIVDHEPGIVPGAEPRHLGKRRQVPVHAEYGVRRDDAHGGSRGFEPRGEGGHVEMRITGETRAREDRAVVEARMVQLVGEDLRVAIGECREDAEVRRSLHDRAGARRGRSRPSPRRLLRSGAPP